MVNLILHEHLSKCECHSKHTSRLERKRIIVTVKNVFLLLHCSITTCNFPDDPVFLCFRAKLIFSQFKHKILQQLTFVLKSFQYTVFLN